MPVLEDGLSSSQSSDTENSNQYDLQREYMNFTMKNKMNFISTIGSTIGNTDKKGSGINNKKSPVISVPGVAQRSLDTSNNISASSSSIIFGVNETNLNKNVNLIQQNVEDSCNSSDTKSFDTGTTVKTNEFNLIDCTNNQLEQQQSSIISNCQNLNNNNPLTFIENLNSFNLEKEIEKKDNQNVPIHDHKCLSTSHFLNINSPINSQKINSNSESIECLETDALLRINNYDEDEPDTDLETDRLLGEQRIDEQEFSDSKPKIMFSKLNESDINRQIEKTTTIQTIGHAEKIVNHENNILHSSKLKNEVQHYVADPIVHQENKREGIIFLYATYM